MKVVLGVVILAAVSLFFWLIGNKGNIKKNCNSCINCPIKDCAERKDAIEE